MPLAGSWGSMAMREPETVAAYAASIAERLEFDPSLARRVRQEVEDHLWESMRARAVETVRDATTRFGDPQVLAAEFATAWLAAQTRKTSAVAIIVVLVLLLVMKVRLAWYGIAQWTLNDELRLAGSAISSIDVCAFWLAVGLLAAAWAYLTIHRVAASCAAQCRKLRHVVYLTALCWFALAISVTCDVIL